MKHEILTETCEDGIEYAEQYNTLEEAWMNCQRGDWMLWLACKLRVPSKKQVLAKGLCAQTVLHLMTDDRSIEAVAVAIAFGRGKATRGELDSANAAAACSNAAHVDAAAFAAHTAAVAVHPAHAAAARTQNQKQTADICREVLTRSVFARLRELRKENKNET